MRDEQTTYRIMSAIKSKNTSPERLLGSAMWKAGLRYRKHFKIKGNPDFVLTRVKMAIFCDGDFWHGNNWRIRDKGSLENELSTYNNYWACKISTNVKHDKLVTDTLTHDGWMVLRFWESEIHKSPEECVNKIYAIYNQRLLSNHHRKSEQAN